MESSQCGEPSIKVLVIYENVSKKIMKTLGGFLLNQIRTFSKENPVNTVGGACAGTFGFDGYHLDMDGFTFQDAPRSMDCLMSMEDFVSSDFNIGYEKECTVPKYDLLCIKEVEGKNNSRTKKSKKQQRRNGRRCFNCRSYNHTVDRCFHAVNKEEVKQNIRAFNEAKSGGQPNTSSPPIPPPPISAPNSTPPPRNPLSRSSTLEFQDAKPGEISQYLREGLGVGEQDPPPWLFRMRELGPPPAYRDMLGEHIKHFKHVNNCNNMNSKKQNGRPQSASTTTSGAEEGEIQSENEENEDIDEEPSSKRQKLHQNFEEFKINDLRKNGLENNNYSNKIYYPGLNGPIVQGGDPVKWKDGGRSEYYKRFSQNNNKQQKNLKNSKSSDLSNCSTTIVVAPPMIPNGPMISNSAFRCIQGVQPFAPFEGWCLGGRVTGRSEPLPQFNGQQSFFTSFQQ
eukprot:TRINITY_DN6749_c0_g3_i1.p1 TRINITY_DN6749_c0_g3~~TRINITY_DN6749_c0_g3_i1.p1  ORF type:complete len:453 (-),score=72.52 TRINITY_DN6749_c0_g3_i1:332-1690(-)